jgi:hypothetical protein
VRTGCATFFSRNRKSLWTTCARIVSTSVDRDRDSALLRAYRSNCESGEPRDLRTKSTGPRPPAMSRWVEAGSARSELLRLCVSSLTDGLDLSTSLVRSPGNFEVEAVLRCDDKDGCRGYAVRADEPDNPALDSAHLLGNQLASARVLPSADRGDQVIAGGAASSYKSWPGMETCN